MKLKAKHIMVLVSLCLATAASVGLTTNIAGLFFSPIAEDFRIGRGSVSITMTICNLTFAMGGIVIGRILSESRFKLIMLVSVILTVVSTAGLAICNNVWLMYILNGIRGFTTGLTGVVMGTMVVNNWFFKNTATMTSIVMGFSGLAGAVFSPLFSSLIASAGWRRGYLIAAALMAVLFLPILLLPVGLTPGSVGEIPYGRTAVDPEEEKKQQESAEQLKKAHKEIASRTPKPSLFLILTVAVYATMGGCLTAIVQHFPGVSESYGLTAAVGAGMLSASMIANTSGKLLLGVLIDRFGIQKGVISILSAVTGGILLMILGRSSFIMLVGAALIGLAYSAATVGVAMISRNAFGMAYYSSIYPVCSFCTTVSYAIGAALVGFVYDKKKTYSLIFYLMLVFVAIAAVCLFLSQKKD